MQHFDFSNIIRYLAVILFCTTLTGCETAVERTLSMAEAKTSYSKGELERAFRITEVMAYEGDAEAQYALGFMYIKGAGAPRNEDLGLLWIEKAANQGNSKALAALDMIQNHSSIQQQFYPPKS